MQHQSSAAQESASLAGSGPVAVTLPDGSRREFAGPASGADIAAAIGPGLAKAAVAIRIDGRLRDLATLVDHDAQVAIVTRDSADGLQILRHDAAHVMAEAVKELYPETQVTFGPATETGFYYDFARAEPFTPQDLEEIEARMREIVGRDEKITREVWDRDAAVAFFAGVGERYKAEYIAEIPADQEISLYRQGGFVDLCVGPHLPSTGALGQAFKLMSVAGAYWRGDARNAQLQRIHGAAWGSQKDLDQYLHRLEEAERRDHRRLGRELDLFHLGEEAVGSVFWHPKGWTLYRIIESYMRMRLDRAGYLEIKSPQLLDRSLWEASGHWEKFRDNMFIAESSDGRMLALKPMSCPGHVLVFRHRLRSYRELPLRLAEFGSCHRNEPSGALHGIMRVRAFTQDDAHIFCTEAQVTAESVEFCRLLLSIYRDFGFDDVAVKFSDRPPARAGSDAVWDRAEADLRAAVEAAGLAYTDNPGEGRLLRAKARIRAARRLGPRLAMRHLAARFRAAGAARRQLCRRGWRAPPPGHAAPRDPGLGRALHRHADRALRRPLPAVAGAGAGRRRLDHLGRGGLRRGGGARMRRRRAAGRARHRQSKRSTTRCASTASPRSRSCWSSAGARRRGGRSRCVGSAAGSRKHLRSARRLLN